MQIKLAYGRKGLYVKFPEDVDLLEPKFVPGITREAEAIRSSLQNPIGTKPLGEHVNIGDKVVIVHTDITRATPNERILPVLLGELEKAGIERRDITLLNGLGTHRPQSENELRTLLGDFVVDNYRCLQHDPHDDANLVDLGKTQHGHPVRVNRVYLEADFKILTGFIEPHFFAGFSGGPKAILPSLAGVESVYSNHGRQMIADPMATWGVTVGNPIWEEMREVALSTEPGFLLNVTLNSNQEITGIFAGDMLAAHAQGAAFVKENAMVRVDAPYDIVVTTNSGYPLDQNLYQSVKGMSAASQIVCQGGAIIMAAACEDGLPDHGGYAQLLQEAGSPEAILQMIAEPGFSVQDQWQVQIQAQIQLQADVYVYSHNLSSEQIQKALFKPCDDIVNQVTLLRSHFGPKARICVIPEGPQTIPYLPSEP
ncbi:MAG: nickel-dependent lactate racemase [Anaerolineae bacterium]|nr:MAG: nickel-dependent lactate racemase [Anaerolineae bacterium]